MEGRNNSNESSHGIPGTTGPPASSGNAGGHGVVLRHLRAVTCQVSRCYVDADEWLDAGFHRLAGETLYQAFHQALAHPLQVLRSFGVRTAVSVALVTLMLNPTPDMFTGRSAYPLLTNRVVAMSQQLTWQHATAARFDLPGQDDGSIVGVPDDPGGGGGVHGPYLEFSHENAPRRGKRVDGGEGFEVVVSEVAPDPAQEPRFACVIDREGSVPSATLLPPEPGSAVPGLLVGVEQYVPVQPGAAAATSHLRLIYWADWRRVCTTPTRIIDVPLSRFSMYHEGTFNVYAIEYWNGFEHSRIRFGFHSNQLVDRTGMGELVDGRVVSTTPDDGLDTLLVRHGYGGRHGRRVLFTHGGRYYLVVEVQRTWLLAANNDDPGLNPWEIVAVDLADGEVVQLGLGFPADTSVGAPSLAVVYAGGEPYIALGGFVYGGCHSHGQLVPCPAGPLDLHPGAVMPGRVPSAPGQPRNGRAWSGTGPVPPGEFRFLIPLDFGPATVVTLPTVAAPDGTGLVADLPRGSRPNRGESGWFGPVAI